MNQTEPQFKGPAIAVVVPVHNGAVFLQQCLASLAAQTFADFACFVVDDGSTDESAELAAAWESRDARFVVIHQRQSGVAAARAAGVVRLLRCGRLLPQAVFGCAVPRGPNHTLPYRLLPVRLLYRGYSHRERTAQPDHRVPAARPSGCPAA